MAGAKHVNVKLDSGGKDFDELLCCNGRLIRRGKHQLESSRLHSSSGFQGNLFAGEFWPNATDGPVIAKTQDLTVQRLN